MSKMKKTKIIKSILSLVITVGCLCACGSSDPAGTTSKVTRQTLQEEEQKLSSTAAKEKIFTKEVESVTIRYYIGYNIATGDAINDSIPCHQITVSGDDLETLVSLIGGLTKMAVDQNTDDYLFVESITDDYELTINDDVVLTIGNKCGYAPASSEQFEVPAELYETVDRIAQENNEKNVYKTLGGDQISVTDRDGKVWDIEDDDQLEKIRSTQYYAMNISDDTLEGEQVAYVVDLHNGDQLDVFFASVLGKIRYADGSYEYVYTGNLEEYLDEILR